jgi:hypothetical protein
MNGDVLEGARPEGANIDTMSLATEVLGHELHLDVDVSEVAYVHGK